MLECYEAITTVADVPGLHAARRPEQTALIFGDRRVSYRELALRSNQVANGLIDLGLQAGARAGLIGFDCDKSYEVLFGCAQAGIVLVPVSWRLEPDEITYILQDAEVEVLFVSAEAIATIEPLMGSCRRLRTLIVLDASVNRHIAYDTWRDACAPDRTQQAINPAQALVQVYTSGTSGRPKGVVLAHRGFIDLFREIERAGDEFIDWQPDDASLLALPTFHVGGLWWAINGLINGIQNVVMTTFNPTLALELIEKHRVTKLAFVPAMLRFILSEPACSHADVSSVRLVIYGGSPMPRPILEKSQRLFKCRFAQNYGLSETSNMAVFLPPTAHGDLSDARLNAAGRPLRGVSVRILDRHGRELPAGEVGEIAFKTPGSMLEYWRLPQETAETLVEGWVHTGDAGYVDVDGYVYITDRIKDLIISAGENIYPAEIERVLMEHPDILDVAVIGVPDDRWGEVPAAYVVKRPQAALTRSTVLAYARKRIAGFKLPRTVEFIDKLPRNASGKTLKRVLREPHWLGRERRVN